MIPFDKLASLSLLYLVPSVVAVMFYGAHRLIWLSNPNFAHARTWSFAFLCLGAGWSVTLFVNLVSGSARHPGTTASLWWIGAALLFVHGLRQRARKADRGTLLSAVWGATSIATAFLSDLEPNSAWLNAQSAAIFTAIGLFSASLAVEPRTRSSAWLDWGAIALLAVWGTAHLFVHVLFYRAATETLASAAISVASTLVYVSVGIATMLLLNKDLSIALQRLARIDPLTGIWNRRGFDDAAPNLLARRWQLPLASVAIVDVDSFKSVNDRFGHAVGDAVLVNFALRLRSARDRGDLLARLGGDEFVILALGVDTSALFKRVETFRAWIASSEGHTAALPPITASFGIAQVHPGTGNLRDALERADSALYEAKRQGRNQTILADASHD